MAKLTLPTFAAAILLLCGCASQPIVWHKDGATQDEFAQDKYQCAQETASSGNYAAFGAPLFVAMAAAGAQKRQQGMFTLCMQARGWRIVPAVVHEGPHLVQSQNPNDSCYPNCGPRMVQ